MQLPGSNASSEAYLTYVDYVEAAADGWADAEVITPIQQTSIAEVATLVKKPAADLRAELATTTEAERGVTRARAKLGVRDQILDTRVMALSDAVLNGPAGRSRDNAVYRHIFHDQAAGELVRTAMREEPALVEKMLSRYDSAPDFAGKAEARALVAEAVAKSSAALDALENAEAVERQAVAAELGGRLALRTSLEQAYGKLRAAFPGRRDFTESFFPKRAGGNGAAKDAGVPAPAPVPK